jgi:hypothetical protein
VMKLNFCESRVPVEQSEIEKIPAKDIPVHTN